MITPKLVTSGVLSVSAGANFSLFVKSDGSAWGTGENQYGQVGDGTVTPRNQAAQILTDSVNVSASAGHSLVLKSDGSVWTFGRNDVGQLGDSTTQNTSTPKQVMVGAIGISAGTIGFVVEATA